MRRSCSHDRGRRLDRRAAVGLVAVLLALFAGACSSSGPGDEPAGGRSAATTILTTDPQPATTDTVEPGADQSPSDETTPGLVATVTVESISAFVAPDDPTTLATFPSVTPFGAPRTFLVVGERDGADGGWLEVLLPLRPNGTTGWVRASDVTLGRSAYAVDVDLAARTLVVWRDGEVLLRSPVAIGAPDTPTPTGSFYVTDLLRTEGIADAYGPFAFGLSGFSETLSEFAGGDGQIGLHGTDDPDAIGQAVSHGCVRVPNEVVSQLAAVVPLGTPVTIR